MTPATDVADLLAEHRGTTQALLTSVVPVCFTAIVWLKERKQLRAARDLRDSWVAELVDDEAAERADVPVGDTLVAAEQIIARLPPGWSAEWGTSSSAEPYATLFRNGRPVCTIVNPASHSVAEISALVDAAVDQARDAAFREQRTGDAGVD